MISKDGAIRTADFCTMRVTYLSAVPCCSAKFLFHEIHKIIFLISRNHFLLFHETLFAVKVTLPFSFF